MDDKRKLAAQKLTEAYKSGQIGADKYKSAIRVLGNKTIGENSTPQSQGTDVQATNIPKEEESASTGQITPNRINPEPDRANIEQKQVEPEQIQQDSARAEGMSTDQRIDTARDGLKQSLAEEKISTEDYNRAIADLNMKRTQLDAQNIRESNEARRQEVRGAVEQAGGDAEVTQRLRGLVSSGGITMEQYNQTREKLNKLGVSTDPYESYTSNDFFEGMIRGENFGGDIFYKDNPAYARAKKRLNNFEMLDKSPEGLYLAMKSGELDKDLALYQDLVDSGYGEIIKSQQKKLIRERQQAKVDGTYDKLIDDKPLAEMTNSEVMKFIKASTAQITGGYMQDFRADFDNNEVINSSRDGYSKSVGKLTELTRERNGLYDDLRAKYPNASSSYINALYRREASDLESKINKLTGEAAMYQGAVNTELSFLQSKYQVRADIERNKMNVFNEMLGYKIHSDNLSFNQDVQQFKESSFEEEMGLKRDQLALSKDTLEFNKEKQDFQEKKFLAEHNFKIFQEKMKQAETSANITPEQLGIANDVMKGFNRTDMGTANYEENFNMAKSMASQGYNTEAIKRTLKAASTPEFKSPELRIAVDSIYKGDINKIKKFEDLSGMRGVTEQQLKEKLVNDFIASSKQGETILGTTNVIKSLDRIGELVMKRGLTKQEEEYLEKYGDAFSETFLDQQDKGFIPANFFESVKYKFDSMFGKQDPELVELSTEITRAVVEFTNAVAGVQFSEREMALYKNLFPSLKQDTRVAMTAIKGLKSSSERTIEQLLGAGFGGIDNYFKIMSDGYSIKEGFGIYTPYQSSIEGLNEVVKRNGDSYEIDGREATLNDLIFANDIVIPTKLPQISAWNEEGIKENGVAGLECGEFENLKHGTSLGSLYTQKLDQMDETLEFTSAGRSGGVLNADVGDLVVWKPTREGELGLYGHAGTVVGKEGENYLIQSSNYRPGKITVETIPKYMIDGKKTSKNSEKIKRAIYEKENKRILTAREERTPSIIKNTLTRINDDFTISTSDNKGFGDELNFDNFRLDINNEDLLSYENSTQSFTGKGTLGIEQSPTGEGTLDILREQSPVTLTTLEAIHRIGKEIISIPVWFADKGTDFVGGAAVNAPMVTGQVLGGAANIFVDPMISMLSGEGYFDKQPVGDFFKKEGARQRQVNLSGFEEAIPGVVNEDSLAFMLGELTVELAAVKGIMAGGGSVAVNNIPMLSKFAATLKNKGGYEKFLKSLNDKPKVQSFFSKLPSIVDRNGKVLGTGAKRGAAYSMASKGEIQSDHVVTGMISEGLFTGGAAIINKLKHPVSFSKALDMATFKYMSSSNLKNYKEGLNNFDKMQGGFKKAFNNAVKSKSKIGFQDIKKSNDDIINNVDKKISKLVEIADNNGVVVRGEDGKTLARSLAEMLKGKNSTKKGRKLAEEIIKNLTPQKHDYTLQDVKGYKTNGSTKWSKALADAILKDYSKHGSLDGGISPFKGGTVEIPAKWSEGIPVGKFQEIKKEFAKRLRLFEGDTKVNADELFKKSIELLEKAVPGSRELNSQYSSHILASDFIEDSLSLLRQEKTMKNIGKEHLVKKVTNPILKVLKRHNPGKTQSTATAFDALVNTSEGMTIKEIENKIFPQMIKILKKDGYTNGNTMEILRGFTNITLQELLNSEEE